MLLKLIKKIYHLNYLPYLILLTLIIAFYADIYFDKLPIDVLNEGDFGRDLYSFYLVSKGQLPYIDFNWVYGPLIPLLYGTFFKVFGVSILNAVNLWYVIFITCIYLIFFIVKELTNSFLAFIAAIALLLYHSLVFMTFNHVIGIAFVILAVLFLYKYIRSSLAKYLYYLSVVCILLAMTKLNIAFAFVFPLWIGLLFFNIINKKDIKPVIYSFLLFIFLTALLYSLLIFNSPLDQIPKSFPFTSKSIMHSQYGVLYDLFYTDTSLTLFDKKNFGLLFLIYRVVNLNLWYIILPLFGLFFSYIIFKREKDFSAESVFVCILSILALTTCHEFILAGTAYSLRFWPLPIIIILVCYIVYYLINNDFLSKKVPLYAFIFFASVFLLFTGFQAYNNYAFKNHNAFPYLRERAKAGFIYYDWLLTFNTTINYINQNVKPDEKLFSLPYNMLYNFISERDQPSRYLEMYYYSNVNNKDQDIIINNLEKNKVKVILYSYKNGPTWGGKGYFGVTHCQKLDRYIKKNYYVDVTYAYKAKDTMNSPISFYKRKTPFKNVDK